MHRQILQAPAGKRAKQGVEMPSLPHMGNAHFWACVLSAHQPAILKFSEKIKKLNKFTRPHYWTGLRHPPTSRGPLRTSPCRSPQSRGVSSGAGRSSWPSAGRLSRRCSTLDRTREGRTAPLPSRGIYECPARRSVPADPHFDPFSPLNAIIFGTSRPCR